MRLTKKLKQRYVDAAKEEWYKLTGIHVDECMLLGNGLRRVLDPMEQYMTIFMDGNIACCVEGDRYYTDFYCEKLPEWMTYICIDGQVGHPSVALPKERYDVLKGIATSDIKIKAVEEWNALVEEYRLRKSAV
jgi:hypothetical protein